MIIHNFSGIAVSLVLNNTISIHLEHNQYYEFDCAQKVTVQIIPQIDSYCTSPKHSDSTIVLVMISNFFLNLSNAQNLTLVADYENLSGFAYFRLEFAENTFPISSRFYVKPDTNFKFLLDCRNKHNKILAYKLDYFDSLAEGLGVIPLSIILCAFGLRWWCILIVAIAILTLIFLIERTITYFSFKPTSAESRLFEESFHKACTEGSINNFYKSRNNLGINNQ